MVDIFSPAGNAFGISFSTAAANVQIPNAQFGVVRITNNSGNLCFVSLTTSAVGNIAHPTPGAAGSSDVTSVPNAQTTYLRVPQSAVGDVWVNTISVSGTGNIYVQGGTVN
jgi:hypothetical protein